MWSCLLTDIKLKLVQILCRGCKRNFRWRFSIIFFITLNDFFQKYYLWDKYSKMSQKLCSIQCLKITEEFMFVKFKKSSSYFLRFYLQADPSNFSISYTWIIVTYYLLYKRMSDWHFILVWDLIWKLKY